VIRHKTSHKTLRDVVAPSGKATLAVESRASLAGRAGTFSTEAWFEVRLTERRVC
jgi:hypothetical protein